VIGMPAALRDVYDEPAHHDPVVRGFSEAIGGPMGEHAVRGGGTGGSRFWTPVRIVLALACLMLAMHWVQKAPCRDGAWVDYKQYKYYCYSDVLALYYAERLHEGAVPYVDHPVEYPVLTGVFMGLLGLPVHAAGERNSAINQGQAFYDLNALVLGALGVAAVGALLAMRRRRPWDAAMFALAPGLMASATVNWDLLAVSLTAFTMLAWAQRKPLWAGLLLGLAIAAKFYPLLLLGGLLVLALRTNRWREFLATFGVASGVWLALNVPVMMVAWDGWMRFWELNSTRGIDWGTLWYIGAHFPRGEGQYGFEFFRQLDVEPEHGSLNNWYLGLFVLACVAILVLGLMVRKQPRLAQLVFLIVAAFLLTGKVWSQQYVLWLIPLAILARPRWGAFLAWQVAELLYFFAFYGELMGATGKQVFPEGVFVLASTLRFVTLAVLVGFVVRDMIYPEYDDVRRTYREDPDGGVFAGFPDAPARWIQELLGRVTLRQSNV
jgi:uncharacterized membrane protein